jgi:integrase
MQTETLTYTRLLEDQARAASTGQLKNQTAANRATALRLFLRANYIQEGDPVGPEMRAQFPIAVQRLVDSLKTSQRSDRSISNTRSALTPWKKSVLFFDQANAHAQGLVTPFQASLRDAIGELHIRWVAREAGVSYQMLLGWLQGKLPRASNAHCIRRIESFFGVPKDCLVTAAGIFEGSRAVPKAGEVNVIDYREKLSARTRSHYYFKPGHESPLRLQWRELLRYKTAPVAALERGNGGRWTMSALNVVQKTERNWWAFQDGVEVPSALAAWNRVASYLGWLSMPAEDGGGGVNASHLHTLAWLAVPDYVESFLNWRKQRAGGKLNHGALEFLALIQWMVRPGDGYLYQLESFSQTLPEPFRNLEWNALCKRQYIYTGKLKHALAGEVTPSRDPFEPIRHVLELEQPMEAIADMLQRMRYDRPVGNAVNEAIWARDMFLIKLMATTPLRKRNLVTLSWSADNKGHLYQRTDGSWWIRVPRREFKNRTGNTTSKEYDTPLHETVWPDLERYIFVHRKVLLRWESDLVFLAKTRDPQREHRVRGGDYKRPGPTGHLPLMELSRHVAELTQKYLWKCNGVGTHAFRHIVATSILKAPAGDLKTAALVLNDAQSTVEKHYAHLTSGDGAHRMAELLGKTLRRM